MASEDDKSKEWLKDYLRRVYGVSFSGPNSLQHELSGSGQHLAAQIVADEFIFRLLARFNDLDVAPKDGYISMAELDFAINNPRLYFDQQDQRMLKLLKHYYHLISQLLLEQNQEDESRKGISRQGLELLASSELKTFSNLRAKLEQEFTNKETV